MGNFFKKIDKFTKKVIKKTVPKQYQKTATKLFYAANPGASYNQFVAEQAECKDTACRRAALRRHHERTTTPFSRTADKSYKADLYLESSDPNVRAVGQQLRAGVDASTLRRGKIGGVVGGLFAGGVAAKAISAGTAGGETGAAVNPYPEYEYPDYSMPGDVPGHRVTAPRTAEQVAQDNLKLGLLALGAALAIFT